MIDLACVGDDLLPMLILPIIFILLTLQNKETTMVDETGPISATLIITRLLVAAVIGGLIGYERRMHHKAIGISGMMMVAVGSATYMLLAKHLSSSDPAALSRTLQGLLQGIGFLGGAVIFKGGTDVHGIKTAAAIWITGAIGLSVGTWFWWLGVIVGLATALILFVADRVPVSTPRENEAGTKHLT
ncbi:MAG: MgtC/SapB family protein [Chloroflexota bacterium]|nr:MgtC/SapB family protein [Chloroflexota bacterium]